jgi:ATP-binding cassette subfamily B protein
MKPIDLIKPYFAENRYQVIFGMISLIIVDVLQLFIPRIIKGAVDDLTLFSAGPADLLYYALLMAGVAVLIGIFRFIWRHCLLGTSRRVEEGLRNALFSHLQTLPPAYYDRAKSGDLMAHATNDIQQVRMATGMGLVAFNDALVLGSAAIVFMAFINLKLTLFVLIPMPVIVVGTRILSRRMHRGYQRVQSAFADLTEAVRERFAGIRIIKSYNWEAHEASRIENSSRAYVRVNLQLVKVTGAFFPMMMTLTNLSLAMVIFLGGRQTITQTITPGDLVAFISYLGLLTWPMMALGWVTNLIQRGKASLERLETILETRPDIVDSPSAAPMARCRGSIVFENVTFGYGSGGDNGQGRVLSGIDLNIPAGSTLGIVGPPGSGKTSLLNLLPRLYEVSDGRILLDGRDIRNVRLRDLRSQMVVVPQEPFLFAGSVRHNILLGDPNLTDAQLVEAARAAAVHDTIQSLPQGYDTVVGERGIILSGGQKQRIALARALARSSPLMILDDPISQVDIKTGNRIIDTLRTMAGTRTIIIVSHRLSAVRFADRIISLDNGRIVESGSHASLLRQNRYYAGMHRLQEIEEDWYAN